MTTKTKAVVAFDLDGTLLDTLPDIAAAMNQVLEDQGFTVHETPHYAAKVGHGMRDLVKAALPEVACNDQLIDFCTQQYGIKYQELKNKNAVSYQGISELLEWLQNSGLKVGCITNKRQDFAEICLQQFFPQIHFEFIIGNILGRPRKPDPQVALALQEKYKIHAPQMVYVGDSDVDIEFAKNAGCIAVGVTWGYRSKEILIQQGADFVFENVEQLSGWLKQDHQSFK
jgi:phosphoglycolate phosphatase